MIKKVNLTIYLFVVFLLNVVAQAKVENFEIKPFPTFLSSDSEISDGIINLYKNNIKDDLLKTEIEKAKNFQNLVYKILNSQIQDNSKWIAETSEKTLTGNFVKETTVKFKSLIQRPANHASNDVIARIYEPVTYRPFCNYRYPTTIFLHHILNEIELIQDISKIMAAGVFRYSYA